MKRSQIVQEVSLDLNDQVVNYEYLHWTAEQLDSYIAEIFINLADDYQELFYSQMIVTLDPAKTWQDPCSECTEILKVYGEVDENGQITKVFYQKKDNDIFNGAVFDHTDCTDYNTDSDLYAYSINPVDAKSFRVYGKLKPDETGRRVLIQCYQEPDPYTEDIPNKFVAAIKQWMLYRAMIIDSENNQAIATIASKHLETYNLLVQKLVSQRDRAELKRHVNHDVVQSSSDSTPSQVPNRS